ncbi:MAG: aminopeptidase P family protein [Pirellulales bacterium]|nr:aminopeptidase P family protein [Pirellulales bacterium]
MDRHATRRDRLRKAINRAGADALLVTNFTNVTYLTGFTGDDSYLLVARRGERVLSDSRYTTQLGEECPGLDLHIRSHRVTMIQAVAKVLKSSKIGRLAIEADSMTVSLRNKIAAELPRMEIVATSGLVENLRQIKDKHEIARIRRAVWCAEKAFGVIRATLRPEMSEKQVAVELEHQMRLFGARYRGFASIVGVGPRAALPHAVPTDRQIRESDFVLIDWGADEGLYKSDLTRVLVTGKISPKLERIYGVVLKAQTRAIAAIRPGALAKDIDKIARETIANAGYGRRFGHGLGHGVGLEIHEAPRLAAKSETVLKPGMVITVEPGIYLPGWGGVRIEDDVLVTRKGHEVLTSVPKQWESAILC